ncbi:hypothetical protein J1614_007701 [Plenodomus biglobosus]|nr:hypothetical protein J1614_007701 [Plenodomus biglobosus]
MQLNHPLDMLATLLRVIAQSKTLVQTPGTRWLRFRVSSESTQHDGSQIRVWPTPVNPKEKGQTSFAGPYLLESRWDRFIKCATSDNDVTRHAWWFMARAVAAPNPIKTDKTCPGTTCVLPAVRNHHQA